VQGISRLMTRSILMNGHHERIGWVIVAALLLLRIPYSIILTYASANNTGWAPAIFQLVTYLLTVFLVCWERDDLAAMHMDMPSIGLIMLFKPVQTLMLRYWGIETPLTFPHPAGLLIWATSIGLIIALWRSPRKAARIQSVPVVWLIGGFLVGLVFSALPELGSFLRTQDLVPLPSVAASTGLAFFYQIGFAAVSEEPLFRGFLWGYLRRLGWPEGRVWLSQALLFMLAHLYFINALRFQFWVLVPSAALMFGLLAWRSRSVAPGMLAHAAYNSGAYILLLNALAALLRSF
jgi:membrane protease YdiL (CAAX protease family)